jgi:hypothetical protein
MLLHRYTTFELQVKVNTSGRLRSVQDIKTTADGCTSITMCERDYHGCA